jgi:hypothetical protein
MDCCADFSVPKNALEFWRLRLSLSSSSDYDSQMSLLTARDTLIPYFTHLWYPVLVTPRAQDSNNAASRRLM